jgi:hypothetical protein
MRRSPEYRIWVGMKNRCLNLNCENYADYGGRGITVCERWNKFENFYADMGPRPNGTSINRIDNDGNYEPGNCHWATNKEQHRNKRSTVMIEWQGEKIALAELADRLGIKYQTLWKRYLKGQQFDSPLRRVL